MSTSYIEMLDDPLWNEKRLSILKRDQLKCRMCGAESKVLSVHHKYYIYNHSPWEYDDGALITLCEDCHSLVHKTISPLIYAVRDNNLIRMNYTPCARCDGRGILKEYDYIQGGICFRCRGARFEELIDKKDLTTVNIENVLLNTAPVFDILNSQIDINSCMRIFSDAKNYQFGMNGYPYDIEIAESKYYEAAINGYGQAQNNLGILFQRKDRNTALRWFVYASMQGVIQAQRNVLKELERNTTVDDWIKDQWKEVIILNDSEDKDNEAFIETSYVLMHAQPEALNNYFDELRAIRGGE